MASNSRITAGLGVVIFVLLAVEGLTILRVQQYLNLHVFIGMVLLPPVALKIASTGWRFFKYYTGDPAYTRKGPPPIILRLLGPFEVFLTFLVLASGIALVTFPSSQRQTALFVHKASFVLWFGATTIHVLGHLKETVETAPQDLMRRTRSRVRGGPARLLLLGLTIVAGAAIGLATWGMAAGMHFGGNH